MMDTDAAGRPINQMIAVRGVFAFASLMMVAGIGTAALAAHASAGPEMASAALLLLTNAPMLGATAIALSLGFARLGVGMVGAIVAFAGAVLFAADMAHRGFGHGALFVDAAPIGGSMDMLGWLAVTVAIIIAPRRQNP